MENEFGLELRRLMRSKEASRYWLGITSGLGPKTICRLLQGQRRANERRALRIAVVLFMEPRQSDATNDVLQLADAPIFLPSTGLRWSIETGEQATASTWGVTWPTPAASTGCRWPAVPAT